MQIRQDPFS